jgi:hypothetical protein
MPYNLSNFDGRSFVTLADGVVDRQASSSLYLIGKDVTGYGTIQNDNFLWLLENFAGTIEPVNKVQGQIWFDKNANVLKPKIYDGGEWRSISLITSASTSSTNATVGDFWYDTSKDQLYIKNTSSSYTLVGTESVSGFNKTKFTPRSVLDIGNVSHACIIIHIDGSIVGVLSNDEFFVNVQDEIYAGGIVKISRGLNFSTGSGIALPASESAYLKAELNEVITGRWTFNNSGGIAIGTSTIFTNEFGNLTLQAPGRSVVINATDIRPVSGTTTLGTASSKFAKVFSGEINAGSSITSANLVGKFILTSGSKIEPGTDATISLGAANARFSTVFTKGLNAGGTNEEGIITGGWKLGAGSTLDVSEGTFVSDNASVVELVAGRMRTRFITAGSTSTTGQIEGNWSFTANSRLTAGNLTASSLNSNNASIPTLNSNNATIITLGSTDATITTLNSTNVASSRIDATALYSSTVVQTPKLTTGSSSALGQIEGDWSLTTNSKLRAVYADIAEKYSADNQYESGTVVMFGGTAEVTIASSPKTTKVAGIVTTNPAQILNDSLENSVAIALIGRVPCKVVGAIFKGDMLVVSKIPGVLMASATPTPGSIVAKAMEFYNSDEVGVIEVMVTRG